MGDNGGGGLLAGNDSRGLVFSARVRAGLGRRKLEPGAPRGSVQGGQGCGRGHPVRSRTDKGTHARCGGAADLYYTDGNERRSFCL